MKSKNCSHDVEDSDVHCGVCGQEVVLENEMKKCPSCKDLQNANVLSCTKCKKRLIICKEKKKDGSSCEAFIAENQNFCTGGCGKPVKKDADELDGRKQTQVTQPVVIAGPMKSPKENNTESGDVTSGNNNQCADGPKVKEEIDSRESGGEAPTKKCATRGLAVICTHDNYTSIYKLSKRVIAEVDNSLMVGAWKSYGCEILSFKEKTNTFYKEELTSKIEDKLEDMKSIDYFVFVLSTHGEETREGSLKTDGEKSGEVNMEENNKPLHHEYHHYFYSKDGRYKTQVLIDAIGKINGLEGKLKMFFIQACRGRVRVHLENQDPGHDIAVVKEIYNQSDAVGNMPAEDNKINQSKPKTEGVDKEDAKGYMPEEENNIGPDEIRTTVAELHCDDCVVAFASMSGKYAYRKENDPNQGSWLLRALHTTMIEQNNLEDTVHILDILTGVSREVSIQETETEKKSQTWFLHNLTFSDEQLQFKYQCNTK